MCIRDREKGYLITKKEFDLMKQGVYFVNNARGALVCEHDLIEALDNGCLLYTSTYKGRSEGTFFRLENGELTKVAGISPTISD